MAFKNISLTDVMGVELMDSPPLVSKAEPHNLSFFDEFFDVAFTAHLAEALFPSRFSWEMERTVRNDGVCVVPVEECGGQEVMDILALFRMSRFVDAINVTVNGSKMTRILMRRYRLSA